MVPPMIIVKGKITFFPLTAPAPFMHLFSVLSIWTRDGARARDGA
jgi:hypothetical protein